MSSPCPLPLHRLSLALLPLSLAVAVGGNFFPPNVAGRPWGTTASALAEFWAARDSWLPSWTVGGIESSALAIDYVRVWQKAGSGGKVVAAAGGRSLVADPQASTVWPTLWGAEPGHWPARPEGAGSGSGSGGGKARRVQKEGVEEEEAAFPPPPQTASGVCAIRVNVSADVFGDCEGVQVTAADAKRRLNADGQQEQQGVAAAAAGG